jgi:hypothetical protein
VDRVRELMRQSFRGEMMGGCVFFTFCSASTFPPPLV